MICERCKIEYFKLFGSGRYCSRSCANARIPTTETNRKRSNALKGKSGRQWTEEQKLNQSKILKEAALKPNSKMGFKSQEARNRTSESLKGRTTITNEGRERLSVLAKQRNFGGSNTGGYSKRGWYKGIWCDSSWELAFVIYHLDHNILFERNKDRFEYDYNNQKHIYTPDFKIDNTYIEIKNYEKPDDKYKWQVVPNLKVLFYEDLKIYLDYAKEKYGRDFIKLYS